MTTPTDPTTLRTALEALVQKWSDEAISAMSNGLTEQAVATEWCASDLRAVLATPAPAADEARCAFVGCGGVRDDVFHEPCLPGGAFHDHKACHPFQPAPTPAPPTPPATERCAECAGQGLICLAGCPPPMDDRCPRCHGTGTPPATGPVIVGTMTDDEGLAFIEAAKGPATEPVAALVEAPGYSMFRQLRERSDMTLRAAAPRLGIDFTYLSKVENGHERPSDALVRKMGALYGFDAESMLVGRAAAEMPEPVRRRIIADALAAARDEVDVAGLADAMDEHERRWAHDPEDGGTCGPWCAGDIAAAYRLVPPPGDRR